MICEICKDEAFLALKAEPATPDDLPIAADLLETLEAHKDGCVGMAASAPSAPWSGPGSIPTTTAPSPTPG